MSFEWVEYILEMPISKEFTSEMKLTAAIYAKHAKGDGSDIYPSIGTIARETGYHERSVQRYKKSLINLGLLVSDGIGRGGTNKYKMVQIDQFGGVAYSHPPSGVIPSGGGVSPELRTTTTSSMYLSEIGKITPYIDKQLIKAIKDYTDSWVCDAIGEAVTCGKPNLKYILAILGRWKSEGKDTKKNKVNGKYVKSHREALNDELRKQGYTID